MGLMLRSLPMRWRAAWLVAALLVLLVAGLGWRYGAALGVALGLAVPASASWLGGWLADPARESVTIRAEPPLEADVYRPGAIRDRVLLVHGLSRAGRRQPDLE